jgi:iron complex outermembrane receptor protein
MTADLRQRLLATTLLVGAGMLATPALAQTAPQPDGPPTTVANPSGPPEAQPTPSVSATGAPVEEAKDIVVTGTRIPSPNLNSVAPVTVVTSQDIKLQGVTRVEDLLNSLPQVFAAQSSTVSNGSTGTATVNLRGLGSNRTLVLINGRRLMPGDPTSSAADLNFVPSSLIKRVDVLTGGASATYGADAVAGVVNFIMDTNFTGVRFDGNVGIYQHNNRNKITPPLLDARAAKFSGYGYPKHQTVDGGSFDGTISIGSGFSDNRGHAVAYFGYRKVRPVLQSNRDYSACTIQNTGAKIKVNGKNQLNPAAPLQCGGSATSATGTAFYHTSAGSSSTVGALGPGTLTQGTLNRYNFAPLNYYQRPDERYTAGVFANYELSPAAKPYLEFMFMDDRTVAQIAPSGDFGNTNTINCDNPLLSASQKDQICQANNLIVGKLGTFPLTPGLYNSINGTTTAPPALNFFDPTTGTSYNQAYFQLLRRNVEGGPRQADFQHTSFRGLVGMRGDLDKAWSYDGYYQYGRTNYNQVYSNEFSVSRLRNALDAVRNPANGQIVCRSVLTGSDPNCQPYDVFGGTPSAASIAYLSATGFQKGLTSEQVASASFTGLLGNYGIKSPLATEGVSVNVGAEYRKEGLNLQTDNAFQTGDLTGQGAATLPVSGSYNVKELFGEIRLPLIHDNFIYDLSVDAGYRYSAYKVSNGGKFNTSTYKIGVEFAPIRDVRFRGGYNRAVRVPNIQELFGPQIVALDGSTDPCSGFAITAADRGCLAQGLRVGQTVTANPAGQYNGFIGGNPNLKPEVATTKTLGVVLQPSFVPRFAVTVDYFDIKVKKAVQGFGADAILTSCTNDVNPVACALIHRDPAGSLWLSANGFVTDLPFNVGSVQTRGIEVNGSYSHRLGGLGNASASLIGTKLSRFKVDNGLTAVYDCAGYFGPTCGTPAPKWRHKARVTLDTPVGVGLSLQWRYVGKANAEYKNPSSTLSGNYYNFSSQIKAQNYFDLATTFTVGNHYNLRIGVNNLLDRQPPLITSGSGAFGASLCPTGSCNGNTYPGLYDALGRYLYAGVTINL